MEGGQGAGVGGQHSRKVTLEENKVLEALIACEPEPLASLDDPGLPASHIKTVSTLSDIYDRELVATIGWAKQVSESFQYVTIRRKKT